MRCLPYPDYYVLENNNTSQSDLKSDSQSDLKKPRSGLKDWLFSKLGKSKPVPEDSPNTQCSNCQKKNATIQFYEVAFCSQKCKDEAMQKYQAEHELGEYTCLLAAPTSVYDTMYASSGRLYITIE